MRDFLAAVLECAVFHHHVKSGGTAVKLQLMSACKRTKGRLPGADCCKLYAEYCVLFGRLRLFLGEIRELCSVCRYIYTRPSTTAWLHVIVSLPGFRQNVSRYTVGFLFKLEGSHGFPRVRAGTANIAGINIS